jgi:hypothetical protein
MATTGYQAALDSDDLIMAYAAEAVWGTNPAAQLQNIRLDSESLSSQKTRTRPNEIASDGQASAAITTKQEATGDINFSVSAGTHNALLAASIGGVFETPVAKSASTIASTSTGFTDSGNGFVTAGIAVGQMIKVSGFTTTGLAANGIYRVLTVAAGTITTSPVPGATKAAGDTVLIKGSMCRNGTTFQSFFLQKQLAAAQFLQYAGCWPSGGSLDVGVGDYLKGGLSFLIKSEAKAIITGGSGSNLAAPTGTIIDSVSGISNVLRNGTAVGAIQKLGAKWSWQGSRAQYGIGSSVAQGIGKGKFQLDGTLSTYFKDFTLYDQFISETTGPLSFQALDLTGKGYVFTFCNATIMNPKIVAGGSGQDVLAEFTIEGNPDVASAFGGKTFQIDYFA